MLAEQSMQKIPPRLYLSIPSMHALLQAKTKNFMQYAVPLNQERGRARKSLIFHLDDITVGTIST